MTDAEVFACVKLVRGSRASSGDSPFSTWTFGNLRLTDAVEFLPKLDWKKAGGGPGAPARLDVLVGSVLVEQWVITPGLCQSDATAMSLFGRTLYLYLRSTEIFSDVRTRHDVDVRLSAQAVLASDAAHRQVWTMGPDGTSIAVMVRPSWKRDVETADMTRAAAVAAAVVSDTCSVGSSEGHIGSAPPHGMSFTSTTGPSSVRTPPMAPQRAPIGSFGTSPAIPGAIGLAAPAGGIQNGSFMLPPAGYLPDAGSSLPTLVPVGAVETPMSSPITSLPAQPGFSKRMPFFGSMGDGLGDGDEFDDDFDDDDDTTRNNSAPSLHPTIPDTEKSVAASEAAAAATRRRAEVTAFLTAVDNMSVAPIPLVDAAAVAEAMARDLEAAAVA